eukprot:PITA_34408
MEKIRYGKWATSIAVGVLFTLLAPIIAQPGFLNIDCGGKRKRENLTWVTDVNYIDVGRTVDSGNASLPSYLQSLRLFPKPLNKSCYKLRIAPNVRYLLRVWWALGNSSDFKTSSTSFTFSIETMDMLASRNINIISDSAPITATRILVSSGRALYICFIRTSEMSDPFVNAIQLRTLGKGMYEQAKPGTMLRAVLINSVGGNLPVSYPQDKFDRVWDVGSSTMAYTDNQNRYKIISTGHRISTNNTTHHPPTAVLQAAWKQLLINSSVPFLFNDLGGTDGNKALLFLYFAEIEPVNTSEPRSFYITVHGERSETITLVQMYSAVQLTFLINPTIQAVNSTLTPILNALELYEVIVTLRATYSQDIKAVSVIKRRFNIKEWVSDPCFLIPWDGVSCDNSSSIVRISKINLSARNLTGTAPEHIGQLTALVDVSLDNNNFTGSLPNYSNLTMSERLNLQNNKLSGNVPEWLSQLKNLKELLIQNNNFSGVIPMKVLLDGSLTINYSGNPYLCMHKEECIPRTSKRNILKFVFPITLSGILIIALALAVGIVVYRKKNRKKDVATGIDRVEKQPEEPVDRDYSMIMVPKETMSHAFTVNEMMTATDNFTIKIGQGGFGSVYFGKLAVNVLENLYR